MSIRNILNVRVWIYPREFVEWGFVQWSFVEWSFVEWGFVEWGFVKWDLCWIRHLPDTLRRITMVSSHSKHVELIINLSDEEI